MVWVVIAGVVILAAWLIFRKRNRKCGSCDFYCPLRHHCWMRWITVGPEDEACITYRKREL